LKTFELIESLNHLNIKVLHYQQNMGIAYLASKKRTVVHTS